MKQLTFLFSGMALLAMLSCGDRTNRNDGMEEDPNSPFPEDQMMPMDDTMTTDSLDSLEGPLRP